MCQVERGGHVVVGLVAGIAEHHALVSGTLVVLFLTRHAAVYVVTLLMNGSQNTARVVVELVFGLAVANVLDGAAGHGLQINVGTGTHLAHDDHLAGGDERLHGAVRLAVVSKKLIEYGV